MYLYLERFAHNSHGTVGELFLCAENVRRSLCYTLEPSLESRDLFGALPIEASDYKIQLTHSPRFKCILPLVCHPNRQGIRFHAGNTVEDTQGCILTGLYFDGNTLKYSRFSLDYVIKLIKQLNINKLKITELYGKVPNF